MIDLPPRRTRAVTHPGPPAPSRRDLVAVAAHPLEVTLDPGITLEQAVARAFATAGCSGGYLEIESAPTTALDYVIPALAPDATHAAWYSRTYSFDGPGRIDHLGMIVGQLDGGSFLHGHGRWTPRGGPTALGHILAPATVLAAPTAARGIGVPLGAQGGLFDRLPDAETNFTLFQPRATGADPGTTGALLRIRPNQDLTAALDQACTDLGWAAARVHGLGSVIAARFEDGTTLDSLPTEFLILDHIARAHGAAQGPLVDIVGTDGGDLRRGRLTPDENPVLITAEILLTRLDACPHQRTLPYDR